ncbi:hypothetical protein ACL9RI_26995 [Janthinobacterium sp. Mn2066]|uniref:hypothetical protein n=1 Tax=Janthinobacterium sp. Mn2066 TaxID=3395264 RepID=UPI003BD9CA2B
MRICTIALTTATLSASLLAHAAPMPTQEQINAAVQAGVAKQKSSVPIPVKVTSLQGCQQAPEPEFKGETVCLVGMSAGMRDGFTVLPLRQEGDSWVGVERKHAQFPGPAPAEAQALIRAWAKQEVANNPELAKDRQMQEAQTTMQVKAIHDCEVKRSSGYLQCDTVLSVPGRPDDIKTELTFALEAGGWRYVPR